MYNTYIYIYAKRAWYFYISCTHSLSIMLRTARERNEKPIDNTFQNRKKIEKRVKLPNSPKATASVHPLQGTNMPLATKQQPT